MLQNKSFLAVLICDYSFKTMLIYEPKDMSDELLKVIGQYQEARTGTWHAVPGI